MSRIQPNTTPDAKSQELLAQVKSLLGGTPNLFTTLAHSPAALGFFVGALGALNDSKLSPGLREQIALTVAGENTSDYCASAHTALGKMNLLSDSELAQNLKTQSADPRTQVALSFAGKIVELRGRVSDDDLQALYSAGFSEGEIVDIVAVVGVNIFTNYFNHIAGTEVDFPLITTRTLATTA